MSGRKVDAVDPHPGLLDALFEVGRERQRILANLRSAYERKDFEGVLIYVEQIVGLEKKLEESGEKSN
jgi:hypothetical protein